MIEWLSQPWAWYVAGPFIGLIVPLLLILGNKSFGISSSMRHICASCAPAGIKFFKYDWKKEVWNLFFVVGLFLGALLVTLFFPNPSPISVHPSLAEELAQYGITDISSLVPKQLFSWENVLTLKGFLMMIVGGFLVGFGARYAGGCTSGHAIMGLSTLQLPSLIATVCFMVGGFLMANFILPLILKL
jgi:uncharacterized membrane protein YedE/YeeE